MKRLFALAGLALLLTAPAHGQNARIVTTCGSIAPFGSQPPGGSAAITQDVNGNLCTNTTGGGGGGPITAAAGAYASGAISVGAYSAGYSPDLGNCSTAVAWNGTTGDKTLCGYALGIFNNSAAGAYTNNSGTVSSMLAVGGQNAGTPVAFLTTTTGKLVNVPYATPDLVNTGGGSKTDTSALTLLAASGSGALKEYLVSVQCGRSDAGTTAIAVALSDGTKTRTIVIPNNGGGGGNNVRFEPPESFAANTAVTATAAVGVTTLYCNGQGYNAP